MGCLGLADLVLFCLFFLFLFLFFSFFFFFLWVVVGGWLRKMVVVGFDTKCCELR